MLFINLIPAKRPRNVCLCKAATTSIPLNPCWGFPKGMIQYQVPFERRKEAIQHNAHCTQNTILNRLQVTPKDLRTFLSATEVNHSCEMPQFNQLHLKARKGTKTSKVTSVKIIWTSNWMWTCGESNWVQDFCHGWREKSMTYVGGVNQPLILMASDIWDLSIVSRWTVDGFHPNSSSIVVIVRFLVQSRPHSNFWAHVKDERRCTIEPQI